jgi:hypothetical protein
MKRLGRFRDPGFRAAMRALTVAGIGRSEADPEAGNASISRLPLYGIRRVR